MTGINANLVRKWIVKHGCAMSAPSSAASPALLPVKVSVPTTNESVKEIAFGAIEIELRGARIRLTGPVDADALRSVIDVLRTHR